MANRCSKRGCSCPRTATTWTSPVRSARDSTGATERPIAGTEAELDHLSPRGRSSSRRITGAHLAASVRRASSSRRAAQTPSTSSWCRMAPRTDGTDEALAPLCTPHPSSTARRTPGQRRRATAVSSWPRHRSFFFSSTMTSLPLNRCGALASHDRASDLVVIGRRIAATCFARSRGSVEQAMLDKQYTALEYR